MTTANMQKSSKNKAEEVHDNVYSVFESVLKGQCQKVIGGDGTVRLLLLFSNEAINNNGT